MTVVIETDGRVPDEFTPGDMMSFTRNDGTNASYSLAWSTEPERVVVDIEIHEAAGNVRELNPYSDSAHVTCHDGSRLTRFPPGHAAGQFWLTFVVESGELWELDPLDIVTIVSDDESSPISGRSWSRDDDALKISLQIHDTSDHVRVRYFGAPDRIERIELKAPS